MVGAAEMLGDAMVQFQGDAAGAATLADALFAGEDDLLQALPLCTPPPLLEFVDDVGSVIYCPVKGQPHRHLAQHRPASSRQPEGGDHAVMMEQ